MSSNDEEIEPENVILEPDIDRDRGILTPHDRAFLLADDGEGVREGMSDSAVRQKRHKIRNRFQNALVDIQYLLKLRETDVERFYSGDDWDSQDTGVLYHGLNAAMYHLTAIRDGREAVFDTVQNIAANDILREYAEEHGVFAPVEIITDIDVRPPEECRPLAEVRRAVEDGEDVPFEAHMALEYAGMHPTPREYL